QGSRRRSDDRRLYRRSRPEPDLRGGLLRLARPRGVDRGPVRSQERQLRQAARRLLAQHRSGDRERPVLRPRHAVSLRDLLPRRGAAPGGRGLQAEARRGEEAARTDRHPDRGGLEVLARRGIPPGLLREEPAALQLLPPELWPRPAPATALGSRGRRPLSRWAAEQARAAGRYGSIRTLQAPRPWVKAKRVEASPGPRTRSSRSVGTFAKPVFSMAQLAPPFRVAKTPRSVPR